MAEEQKGFEDTLKDITTDLKRILTNRIVVLKGAYERDIIYYKTMITSHAVSQQAIQLKKLEEQIALDKVNAQDYARTIVDLEDKLVKAQKDCGKAQEVVSDNVDTIVRLQRDYKELEDILNYEHDLGLHGVSDLQELNASLVDQCGILQEKNNSLHEMVNAFKGITPYATNMRVIRKADGTIPIDIHSGVVEQKDNPFPGYLASGRGMVEYPFNPEGEPEPYPYTHPIREIPDYSKVKVRK